VLLVSLDVLPKCNSTVFGIVYVKTSDDRAGAEHLRDTEPVGKCIEPKNAEENHFDDQPGRVVLDWHGVVGAASPFLCRADAPFYIRHMLVFAAYVEL
jgi:hypothetical protein